MRKIILYIAINYAEPLKNMFLCMHVCIHTYMHVYIYIYAHGTYILWFMYIIIYIEFIFFLSSLSKSIKEMRNPKLEIRLKLEILYTPTFWVGRWITTM